MGGLKELSKDFMEYVVASDRTLTDEVSKGISGRPDILKEALPNYLAFWQQYFSILKSQ